jgi:hypothetical protein
MQLTIAAPDELTRLQPVPFSGAAALQLSTLGRWQQVILSGARMIGNNDGNETPLAGCEPAALRLDA